MTRPRRPLALALWALGVVFASLFWLAPAPATVRGSPASEVAFAAEDGLPAVGASTRTAKPAKAPSTRRSGDGAAPGMQPASISVELVAAGAERELVASRDVALDGRTSPVARARGPPG